MDIAVIVVMVLVKETATLMKTTNLGRANPQTTDSANDSDPSFVPVAVQYRRLPSDLTSSQSTSSASEPPLSISHRKAHSKAKPTYIWKKYPFSLQIVHFWALLKILIFNMFRSLNYSLNSSHIRWLQWSVSLSKVLKGHQSTPQITGENHWSRVYQLIGVIRLDSQRDNWAKEKRIDQIANVMPRDRFESTMPRIHFANNMGNENERLTKIWKISQWRETQCFRLTPSLEYSFVDGMIFFFREHSARSSNM
ncbi:PiggyBac transposable element-derived protein 4 [Elysia marginata]|uniref:PiggyBac transposable element-derived protein 4 n=1 Tax=Elysia marginata TaxID=1093978 RepID=A0AAV4GCE6_9GAST|nr:PiggyBac transposable element-derived protein 4 [Elysia marginata]